MLKVYNIFILVFSLSFFSCVSLSNKNFDAKSFEDYLSPQITLTDESDLLNINGNMPESVNVKTLTQTFASNFQFSLQGGKIWMKKDDEKNWSLFLKTGLPFSKKNAFATPQRITQIAADGDILIAFDDYGQLYECYIKKGTIDPPLVWMYGFGWPKKQNLTQSGVVKNNRGWSMGARRQDILWYTDRFGNDHHYGTMGLETVYFLSEDGKNIYFTDSGLPADFSKSILGPDRGSFIAENISVSGSTIFLINNQGEMYTRLIDFDTMGCDPMFFKYTYRPYKQKYDGKNYLSNYTPWGLPNEDWFEQPKVNLTGKAKLTKYITIFQTGYGNDARELRIAGTDSDGNIGYYYKMLKDKVWNFKQCNLILDEKSFLTNTDCHEKLRGDKLEYSYQGKISIKGNPISDIFFSINDMTLTSEGSCTLQISNGKETKQIPFYLVDMWTYIQRYNPGLDGTPRDFFVTSMFNDAELNCEDANLEKLIRDLFEKKNQQIFAMIAEATDKYIAMSITGNNTKNKYQLFLTKDENVNIHPTIYKTMFLYEQPILKIYDSKELTLDNTKIFTNADINEIISKIDANTRYKKLLQMEIEESKALKNSSRLSRWGYNLADLITTVTLLNHVNFPKIKNITSYGGTIMQKNAERYKKQAEYKIYNYTHIISLVDARIMAYNMLLKELMHNKIATLNKNLKLTYSEYFEELDIPKVLKDTDNNITLTRLDKLPLFPGFFGKIENDSENQIIGIVITDIAEKMLKYDGKSTIKFNVNFISIDENDLTSNISGLSFFSAKRGTLTLDNKSITITSGKETIIFKSLNNVENDA